MKRSAHHRGCAWGCNRAKKVPAHLVELVGRVVESLVASLHVVELQHLHCAGAAHPALTYQHDGGWAVLKTVMSGTAPMELAYPLLSFRF